MGAILEEFKEFLQSILDFHTQSLSNAPSKSIAQKSLELVSFTNDYNTKALDKAIEILHGSGLPIDKGSLSVELGAIIKVYSKKFLDANFKAG